MVERTRRIDSSHDYSAYGETLSAPIRLDDGLTALELIKDSGCLYRETCMVFYSSCYTNSKAAYTFRLAQSIVVLDDSPHKSVRRSRPLSLAL